jgi:hypothetical protein
VSYALELGDGETVEVDIGVVGGSHDCDYRSWFPSSPVLWQSPMAFEGDLALPLRLST